MLNFIMGSMVGGLIGVVTMCRCISAGQADKRLEKDVND
ncbi:DUF3789 domain-containing protein [Ruminococcus sp. AM43-6]|jgi:hypothetical protein|nr:DUF3789 domain-containing protein [Ruminococcus sp. AM43-6]MBT9625049.1 DUF3789 domain-containing protein [Ruminococcus bicirculans (ex Wegman et al. 2014)]RGH34818.1 DUF3789 domain-containing protein [Ruminococcus sp. AM43-6]UYJ31519.1 MAG: DUF3789 domain-containing protein [Oscillospiraceae bacterium]